MLLSKPRPPTQAVKEEVATVQILIISLSMVTSVGAVKTVPNCTGIVSVVALKLAVVTVCALFLAINKSEVVAKAVGY